jgi:hypothetical protein
MLNAEDEAPGRAVRARWFQIIMGTKYDVD